VKRNSFLTLLLLSLMMSSVMLVAIQPIKADPATITVPDDYPSIQQAIDNAVAGGVILVRNGTYYENITVNKPLSLIGITGTQQPAIDGGGVPVAVRISADGVLLTGFNVTNSGSYGDEFMCGGIQVFGASECIIANNTACNNLKSGISLINANNNTVANNTCVKNEIGIRLWSWSPQTTSYNIIDNNTCSENWRDGIDSWSYVFKMWTTSYNNITNNFISLNGLWNYRSGIYVGKSNGDIVSGNTIFSNYYGLELDSSVGCMVFHNDFIINNQQVSISNTAGRDSVNQLDDGYPSGGNYYSDYTDTDLNSGQYQNITGSDGIGDTSQTFNSDNIDRYPLMTKCGTFEPTFIQVDFSDSFRDSSGASLYTSPSAFQLLLPNGTVSPSLETGTYAIHTGTTRLMSVSWQGSGVTPDTAVTFDSADGNPTVNCKIYNLTITPVFYNVADNQSVTPSSWSIRFPNGTEAAASSSVVYNQTQAGYYVLFNIVIDGINVTSPPVSLSLTADTVWSPQIGLFQAGNNQTFMFNSNSTLTEPNFDTTNNRLSFNVGGTNGTNGYANITFAENLQNEPEDLVVLQDGTPIYYNLTHVNDAWLLSLNYTHSTHNIEVDFDTTADEPFLNNFDNLFKLNSVRLIYPSEQTPKPLSCAAAMVSDWLSSAFISTKLESFSEGIDTESAFVNQATGKPVGAAGSCVISFGGPVVNPIVKYAEGDATPAGDRAPVKFYADAGTFYFQLQDGTSITGANLPVSVINNNMDMFVIETYKDTDGRNILLCYGLGWQGTYAAGKYFDTEIYPKIASYSCSWIIVKWEDTNANGFVNTAAEGDTYTVIATD
jgi:parallel beta-helix repeat protein